MNMEHGPAAWPFFFLIPIFWVLIIGLVVTLIITLNRRTRSAPKPGDRPGQMVRADSVEQKNAEATLSERFAQGDIDEAEYRGRLEVLRANRLDSGTS